jgi:hypothetical protein
MNINTRIWENSIKGLPAEDLQAARFAHFAREFFIPDKVAPGIYLANVAVLMGPDTQQEGDAVPSPSAVQLADPRQRPLAFPTWFMAAYPDVVLWFAGREGPDRASTDAELTRRATASGTAAGHLIDHEGLLTHAVLRALVDMYREQTGAVLECAAPVEDLVEESESQQEDRSMTAQQAVDLVAAGVTRYERELATAFGDRFAGVRERLVVAGLLQLGYYILVDHAIPLATLIKAADESADAEDAVVEFAERLEVEVFCAEGGEKERVKVEEACYLLRSRVLDIVGVARVAFEADPSISAATRNFMDQPQFKPLRQAIGVRD